MESNNDYNAIEDKANLKNILEEIKQTSIASENLLKTLSEALFDVIDKKTLPARELQDIQSAFNYLMLDNQHFFFQRKLLSMHSRGNNKVLPNASKLFSKQLCKLASKNLDQPPKGILLLLLILRKTLPINGITQQIPKWHAKAITYFDAEESLLLYNTMFNQKSFQRNIEELQSALPNLDWVEQWQQHSIKKLTTYLYFWPKAKPTNNLKILHQYLKNAQVENNTIDFDDFMALLKMALSDKGETVQANPSLKLNSEFNLLIGGLSNYIVKPFFKSNRKLRVAFLVSGQLRGYEHTIKNWQKHLLTGVDAGFYIHTWSQIGMSGTEPFRRNLPFDGDEFNKTYRMLCNREGHDAFVKQYPSLFQKTSSQGIVTKSHISELYQTDNIVIEDAESPEFDGWSNPRKMYYKISKAQSLLDASGKEYDLVIRIRPDKDIRALLSKWSNIYKLVNNTNIILADAVYGVHYGSLMMGDQMAISSQQTMQKYSATYTDAHKLSTCDKLSMNSFFSGHRSVARQCVLNGLSVGRIPAVFGGLLTAKNLPSDLIQKMILLDSKNRLHETNLALLHALKKDTFHNIKKYNQ